MFELRKSRRTVPAVSALSAVSAALAAVVATAVLPAGAAAAQQGAPAQPRQSAAVTVPERYTSQKLAWQPCPELTAMECAEMTVPRDWHAPDAGKDLTIAVSRVRASDPAHRRGVLMMAAGGPGGKGLLRPAGVARKAPAIGAVHDIVSFDQRGVGRSTPLQCQTQDELDAFFAGDFRDRSPAAVQRVVDNSRKLADACRDKHGDLLPYITTEQTVRDMDLFRALLGERKISYYGASYATMVGAYYATLFPQRVERAVLDSNIAFGGTWEDFEKGQPESFQRRFEQDFLPWLAKNDATYHYGRTAAEAKATWERRRSALRDSPLSPGEGKGRSLDPNRFDSGTIQAIYDSQEGFPALATALAALEHWDTAAPAERKLVDTVFGSYLTTNFFAEFLSVTCADTPWNRDTGSWVRRSAEDTAKYPLMGARELAFASACAAWPASPAPRVKVTGKGLPPVLMLNSRHDPATYYEAAQRAHRDLRGSRLVTATGGDHGVYLGGSACTDGIVNKYLLSGELPARDVTCEDAPLPAPAAK
ncbi:alpha/beta hydrolase [Streptomyces telluris]|uniref:Alpha/beta hydrolase n=1 Tax=Streptomyces telluris TaxID=2720021 RepID=A0A9X2LC37_9ACTN|nr:alpha/beta hydrolase [Streptomyces telluris]MCQ8768266.1 alpha/beta hydrolase [Streptomyces telluris]NJP77533.1 alpha/beta hydrolase [Streptomyces telluris]